MNILYYVYAAFLLIGGAIGYAKTKSAPSLGAGALFAIIIAVASVRMHRHPHSSLLLGIVVSVILAIFFFGRYRESKKPMPALPVIVFSAVVLIASGVEIALIHH